LASWLLLGAASKEHWLELESKEHLSGLESKDYLSGLESKEHLSGLESKEHLSGLGATMFSVWSLLVQGHLLARLCRGLELGSQGQT